jgi:hypothetical protein
MVLAGAGAELRRPGASGAILTRTGGDYLTIPFITSCARRTVALVSLNIAYANTEHWRTAARLRQHC